MANRVPRVGDIVLYHHPGDGLGDGLPRDYPAMILEVSGGPIDVAADQQTDGAVMAQPYVCLLDIRAPRKSDWRRCTEGDGSGQWSWRDELFGGDNN